MNAEKFWYSWLKVTIILLTICGLVMSCLSKTPFLSLLNENINHAFFADHFPDSSTIMLQGWLIGILGAVMAGWGITMLFLIYNSMKKKNFGHGNVFFIHF